MRRTIIGMVGLFAILVSPVGGHAQTSGKVDASSTKRATTPAEAPVQSGVYGFSGGKVPGADFPEGVIGECIWIFDQANKNQIAKGECSERRPGKFRVVLKPGRYVVHGPGGNKPIEVKAGQWLNIESVTLLPAGP
jgi:hypothetical protein